MRPIAICARLAVAAPVLLASPLAWAQAETPPTAAELANEIDALKTEYEERIRALEERLADVRAQPAAAPAERRPTTTDNAFNPAIGIVLDGRAATFSADESDIPGFRVGHHGERGAKGLSLEHSEATLSSNIDDKFHGAITLGLGSHPGEATELEIEEAYVRTLPGAGLPDGMRIKAGRALWTLGYLNELHAHADDFADRPLPYRVYVDNHWNDDGLELSWVLPSDLYAEVGGGVFRGSDLPFGGSEDGFGAMSAYARVGGDIGANSAWRIGAYVLDGTSRNRAGGGHDHAHDGEGEGEGDGHDEEGEEHEHEGEEHAEEEEEHEGEEHEDEEHEDEEHEHEGEEHEHEHEMRAHADFLTGGAFTGDGRLWGVDIRYTWAPTGDPRRSELILQGEYFRLEEEGLYTLTEEENGETTMHTERLDGSSSGWYAQAVYKFLPRWRVGVRYARLEPPDSAELSHTPYAVGVMGDWTNSEFGRIRAQFNREAFTDGDHDDQFILQYVMSLGAHAAHAF